MSRPMTDLQRFAIKDRVQGMDPWNYAGWWIDRQDVPYARSVPRWDAYGGRTHNHSRAHAQAVTLILDGLYDHSGRRLWGLECIKSGFLASPEDLVKLASAFWDHYGHIPPEDRAVRNRVIQACRLEGVDLEAYITLLPEWEDDLSVLAQVVKGL